MAWAEPGEPSEPVEATAAVIITEVLTATSTSGVQEFIELHNQTNEPIDLTGWQVWYLSAQAADPNKPRSDGIIPLGEGTDTPIIPAHGQYVLSGRADYLPTVAQQFYAGTMAATGGNLRLVSPHDSDECLWEVQDQLGWGNALYPEGQAVAAPGTNKSVARQRDQTGKYIDTNNNALDFVVSTPPSPGVLNAQQTTTASTPNITPLPTVPVAGCTPSIPDPDPPAGPGPLQPPTEEPPATIIDPGQPATTPTTNNQPVFPLSDVGLITPQITELLPNPAAPQTDAADEFIELYNSNDVPFDLSGFQLQVGLNTKRHYTFPQGTSLAPKSFTSFFSADTGLALSNSGGQVSLLDPFGNVINQSEQYGTAKDGQSWQLANGKWYWSTTPTPNAANVVTLPPAKKKAATTASKKTNGKVKAATTAKTKAAKPSDTDTTIIASTAPERQLHPGVLAAVAGFALLYGAYEYRQDMANKLHQFRANRTARRAARAEPPGG